VIKRLSGICLLCALSVAAAAAAPVRVLFIGNSLTDANDLPGMVWPPAPVRHIPGRIGGF
jgi:hypothetical protein